MLTSFLPATYEREKVVRGYHGSDAQTLQYVTLQQNNLSSNGAPLQALQNTCGALIYTDHTEQLNFSAVLIGPFHALAPAGAVWDSARGLLRREENLRFFLRGKVSRITQVYFNKQLAKKVNDLEEYNFALLLLELHLGNTFGFLGVVAPLSRDYFISSELIALHCTGESCMPAAASFLELTQKRVQAAVQQPHPELQNNTNTYFVAHEREFGYALLSTNPVQNTSALYSSGAYFTAEKFQLLYQWLQGLNALPVKFVYEKRSFLHLRNQLLVQRLFQRGSLSGRDGNQEIPSVTGMCKLFAGARIVIAWSDISLQIISYASTNDQAEIGPLMKERSYLDALSAPLRFIVSSGRYIFGASGQNVICIFAPTFEIEQVIETPVQITALQLLTPKLLAVGDAHGSITLLDVNLEMITNTAESFQQKINLKLYKHIGGKSSGNAHGHESAVVSLCGVMQENFFASASAKDGFVKAWDLRSGKLQRTHSVRRAQRVFEWGRFLGVATSDSSLILYDKKVWVEVKKLHFQNVRAIAPLNERELVVLEKRRIQVLNIDYYGVATLYQQEDRFIALCALEDETPSQRLVAADEMGRVFVVQVAADNMIQQQSILNSDRSLQVRQRSLSPRAEFKRLNSGSPGSSPTKSPLKMSVVLNSNPLKLSLTQVGSSPLRSSRQGLLYQSTQPQSALTNSACVSNYVADNLTSENYQLRERVLQLEKEVQEKNNLLKTQTEQYESGQSKIAHAEQILDSHQYLKGEVAATTSKLGEYQKYCESVRARLIELQESCRESEMRRAAAEQELQSSYELNNILRQKASVLDQENLKLRELCKNTLKEEDSKSKEQLQKAALEIERELFDQALQSARTESEYFKGEVDRVMAANERLETENSRLRGTQQGYHANLTRLTDKIEELTEFIERQAEHNKQTNQQHELLLKSELAQTLQRKIEELSVILGQREQTLMLVQKQNSILQSQLSTKSVALVSKAANQQLFAVSAPLSGRAQSVQLTASSSRSFSPAERAFGIRLRSQQHA